MEETGTEQMEEPSTGQRNSEIREQAGRTQDAAVRLALARGRYDGAMEMLQCPDEGQRELSYG
jgi:hypothetical protein